jgi:hypothetical protein
MRCEAGMQHPLEVSEIFPRSIFILALSLAHVAVRLTSDSEIPHISFNGSGKELLQIRFVGVVEEHESQREILTAEFVGQLRKRI